MQLSDRGGQLVARPAPNPTIAPGWANNDLTQTTPPTIGDPDWMNSITQECVNIVAAGTGESPDKTKTDQVLRAILALIGGSNGRNAFRNASALVASRGTSGTVSSGTSAYTLDGHYLSATGAGLAWSQVAGIGYAPKALQLNCASGLTDAKWAQPIESSDAAPLAGRVDIYQTKITNNTASTITPTLTVKHLNASDAGVGNGPWTGTPAASTTDIAAQALQPCPAGVTTTVAWAFTANAALGNGAFFQLDFGTGLNAASGNIVIGDWDIKVTPGATAGLIASPPAPQIRSIADEQRQCQRYLPAFIGTSSANVGMGMATSTTGGIGFFPFATAARTAPTGLLAGTGYSLVTAAGGSVTGTAPTFNSAALYSGAINHNSFSGLVGGNTTMVNSPTGPFIFTGAEL